MLKQQSPVFWQQGRWQMIHGPKWVVAINLWVQRSILFTCFPSLREQTSHARGRGITISGSVRGDGLVSSLRERGPIFGVWLLCDGGLSIESISGENALRRSDGKTEHLLGIYSSVIREKNHKGSFFPPVLCFLFFSLSLCFSVFLFFSFLSVVLPFSPFFLFHLFFLSSFFLSPYFFLITPVLFS